ncbi:unnamed protein product [Closterium sp. Yama58-4]|nr:unnamed protein product [Closterium sp. Yama58-4]
MAQGRAKVAGGSESPRKESAEGDNGNRGEKRGGGAVYVGSEARVDRGLMEAGAGKNDYGYDYYGGGNGNPMADVDMTKEAEQPILLSTYVAAINGGGASPRWEILRGTRRQGGLAQEHGARWEARRSLARKGRLAQRTTAVRTAR